jgi:hypothetical protein
MKNTRRRVTTVKKAMSITMETTGQALLTKLDTKELDKSVTLIG